MNGLCCLILASVSTEHAGPRRQATDLFCPFQPLLLVLHVQVRVRCDKRNAKLVRGCRGGRASAASERVGCGWAGRCGRARSPTRPQAWCRMSTSFGMHAHTADETDAPTLTTREHGLSRGAVVTVVGGWCEVRGGVPSMRSFDIFTIVVVTSRLNVSSSSSFQSATVSNC